LLTSYFTSINILRTFKDITSISSSSGTLCSFLIFFFFTDPSTTEIYTLSLHDALPICADRATIRVGRQRFDERLTDIGESFIEADRKSTRLNSSHRTISYAVFCLKKKKKHLNASNFQRFEQCD